MGPPDETKVTIDVIAIREKYGGFIGLNSTLKVHADGTLDILDIEFSREETQKVPQERVHPLAETLSRPEWQEIKELYGEPSSFYMVIDGGGKRTQIELSAEAGSYTPVVSVPPILEEVLAHLEDLWRTGT
jgi:hypothetical protein